MTYLNASDLKELTDNARFIEITPSGTLESSPHGKR